MTSCLDENTALALLDGSMADAQRAECAAHLERCNACRMLIAELAKNEPSAPPREQTAPTQVGPYRIERAVGEGSFGHVYRAHDPRRASVVAVKHLRLGAIAERFEREAHALALLDHPAIVRYLEHGTLADGSHFLAMQWLDGPPLTERLGRGPLDETELDALATRLAGGLAHAHARGVVHRDLCPNNVVLPGGDLARATLVDFGLARMQDARLTRTTSQAVLGTPCYMAPEQIRDPSRIDGRADLFALGVILYEAACGQRPFDGDDLFEVWTRIVEHPAPDLAQRAPGLSAGWRARIERLLSKDPERRTPSAEAFLQELSTPGGIALATTPPPSSAQRRAAWIAVGLASVVSLLVVSGLALRPLLADDATNDDAPPQATLPSAPRATTDDSLPPDAPAGLLDLARAPTESAHPPARQVECVGDQELLEKGGHYYPRSADDDHVPSAAVNVVACNITLEDAILEGPHSIHLVGGTLTLRRCEVRGHVELVGKAVLELDHTRMAKRPSLVGAARVIGKPLP